MYSWTMFNKNDNVCVLVPSYDASSWGSIRHVTPPIYGNYAYIH